jgi:hypothetical protein
MGDVLVNLRFLSLRLNLIVPLIPLGLLVLLLHPHLDLDELPFLPLRLHLHHLLVVGPLMNLHRKRQQREEGPLRMFRIRRTTISHHHIPERGRDIPRPKYLVLHLDYPFSPLHSPYLNHLHIGQVPIAPIELHPP